MVREKLVDAYEKGLLAIEGLIAHGRGEAFDYLIGERTVPPAFEAEKAAAAHLLSARHPVLSVNGNTAVLAGKEIIELNEKIGARIEVNIFHRTEERMKKLVGFLEDIGGRNVVGLIADARIPGLEHPRGLCTKEGIYSADVVLVPLEDGDRAEALRRMRKTVLTVDLNPLSRTSRACSVSIVDEISRAIPNISSLVDEIRGGKEDVQSIISEFDNKRNLEETLRYISERLKELNL